jgi:hypothetical protein
MAGAYSCLISDSVRDCAAFGSNRGANCLTAATGILMEQTVLTVFRYLTRLFVRVARTIWGSIQTPYATYRQLVAESPLHVVVLFGFVSAYFFLVSPIKLHSLNPFVLTLSATRLFVAVCLSFLLICWFLRLLGKIMGGTPTWRGILVAWGYSLVPTLLWFLATSIFYVVLPPPRRPTLPGIAFSLLYLTFSLSLFFWKGILYYLTLRFALKLDLKRIIGVSVIFIPTLLVYSLLLYYLGLFKVPFV